MKAFITILVLIGLGVQPALAQDKVGTTAAPFLGIGVGARATAMGWAQVANAGGPSALYWNPSAITQMTTHGVEFTNNDWLVETQMQHFGLVLNLERGGHVGLSITALDYGEIEVTTITSPEGTGELFSPLDLAIGLSYARALTDRFSVGGTVKLIRQTIWNESANGAAVDLGVTYLTGYRNLRIGMSMTNFGTSMQLSGDDLRQAVDVDPQREGNNPRLPANLEVNEWSLPLIFRVGVAMDVYSTEFQRLTVSADGLAPADNSQSANVGGEYAFREFLFIRGGYRQAFANLSEDAGWTVGFGLAYSVNERLRGHFDYVFQEYQPFGTPQMFSLGITF